MEAAFLFVTAAGRAPAWRCWRGSDADIGLIAYEMAMLVTRVGQNLIDARPGPTRRPPMHG